MNRLFGSDGDIGYDGGIEEGDAGDYYYDDGSHQSEEEGQDEDVSNGAESPRSAALRAMGIHSVALQVCHQLGAPT